MVHHITPMRKSLHLLKLNRHTNNERRYYYLQCLTDLLTFLHLPAINYTTAQHNMFLYHQPPPQQVLLGLYSAPAVWNELPKDHRQFYYKSLSLDRSSVNHNASMHPALSPTLLRLKTDLKPNFSILYCFCSCSAGHDYNHQRCPSLRQVVFLLNLQVLTYHRNQ